MQEENKSFNRLTRCERESHINLTEDENFWQCYTTIPKDMKKCIKNGWKKTDEQLYPDGTTMSMTFEAPRRAITIGRATVVKKEYTEEQRETQRNRMQEMRNNQKSNS